MKKYLTLIVLLAAVKLFNLSFFTEELNICQFMSGFASNLYAYDESVAAMDIEVIEYEIKNERLYVTPVNQEVILPVSGIISEVGDSYIEVQSSNCVYRVFGLKPSYRLYQYYQKGMILGYSQKYYIEAISYNAIVSHLVINYESI